MSGDFKAAEILVLRADAASLRQTTKEMQAEHAMALAVTSLVLARRGRAIAGNLWKEGE